ncbi:MAG: hypothetical protein CM1200mP6_08270 [Anaerolineaceae bacterium]|nr:MAG: hypothetical protein CM1200mP6_08270 [Anaerolineaceae bacterium]
MYREQRSRIEQALGIPIPVAVAAVTLMILGGLALLLVSSGNNPFVEPTATITPSATSVPTFTAAPTKKPTNLPTSTSLPPVDTMWLKVIHAY